MAKGFLDSLLAKLAKLSQTVTSAGPRPARTTSQPDPSRTFTDMGPVAGNCLLCGREVYATPNFVLMRLVQSGDAEDKHVHCARWCPECEKVYCLGCTVSSRLNENCPDCQARLVEYHPLIV
jgi:hypothetical protein